MGQAAFFWPQQTQIFLAGGAPEWKIKCVETLRSPLGISTMDRAGPPARYWLSANCGRQQRRQGPSAWTCVHGCMLASCPHLGGHCFFALAFRECASGSEAAPPQGHMVFISLMRETPQGTHCSRCALSCSREMNVSCRSVSWAPFCGSLFVKCYLLWKSIKRKEKRSQ